LGDPRSRDIGDDANIVISEKTSFLRIQRRRWICDIGVDVDQAPSFVGWRPSSASAASFAGFCWYNT
jgi:D-hexose-6-phosphate mutarotase